MSKIKILECHPLGGSTGSPSAGDLFAQVGIIAGGEPLPPEEGWRILTGNNDTSTVGRVVMRYELEEQE